MHLGTEVDARIARGRAEADVTLQELGHVAADRFPRSGWEQGRT
jgi:hypothetical protein